MPGAFPTPAKGRVLGGPAKETERTRERNNEGVLQLQRQLMQEQDMDVEELNKTVRKMKEMGIAINEELVEQQPLLDILDQDVDRYVIDLFFLLEMMLIIFLELEARLISQRRGSGRSTRNNNNQVLEMQLCTDLANLSCRQKSDFVCYPSDPVPSFRARLILT
jgi:hypothetical protein